LPPLENPDETITAFLNVACPKWFAALAAIGIMSAIMSTADGFVNVGAAVLARDLPRMLGHSVSREVLWGRLSSGMLFALAFFFAWQGDQLVAYLGIFSFGSLAAILTPSVAVGLNWNQAGCWAARISIALGVACTAVLEIMNRLGYYPFAVAPAAIALTVSLLAFVLTGAGTQFRTHDTVSVCGRRNSRATG
jgi:Na+/proline symporter